MDETQKKSLAFALLIAVLVFSGLAYFVFHNFLNKGTLLVDESSKTLAPFFITERRLGRVECKTIPCEVEFFAGTKDLLFEKEGFKQKNIQIKIPLWNTANLSLEMEIEPFISKSDLKMEAISNPYRVVTDSLSGFQKLVNLKDPSLKAISFLPNKLASPRYFLGKNHLLILSTLQNPVLININSGEKIFIDSVFGNASQVVISDDGGSFAFENPKSKNLQIFKTNNNEGLIETEIVFKNASYLFDSGNNLIFLSTDYKPETKLFIGRYYTDTKKIEKIIESQIIDQKVEQLFLTDDQSELFIKTKSDVFKLTM